MHFLSTTIAAFSVLAAIGTAHADGLPGLRGHDHTGVTVPNMKEAVDFFGGVLGCKTAMSFGPFSDDKGTFMTDVLGVDSKAVIKTITQVRCGFGSNVELFEYTAPDQRDLKQKNSESALSTLLSMSRMSRRRKNTSTARASQRAWDLCQSMTGRLPARRSYISRRPGGCSSKRSAIPRAWPMRRLPRPCSGTRRILRSEAEGRAKRPPVSPRCCRASSGARGSEPPHDLHGRQPMR